MRPLGARIHLLVHDDPDKGVGITALHPNSVSTPPWHYQVDFVAGFHPEAPLQMIIQGLRDAYGTFVNLTFFNEEHGHDVERDRMSRSIGWSRELQNAFQTRL